LLLVLRRQETRLIVEVDSDASNGQILVALPTVQLAHVLAHEDEQFVRDAVQLNV
jgi:hypothetical protein